MNESSVVGSVWKYKLSKKGVLKELFYEIEVFLVKKGPYIMSYMYVTFNTVNEDSKNLKKFGRWLKKIIINFGRKNVNFFTKVIEKFWSANFFPSPQTRPQVSKSMENAHNCNCNSNQTFIKRHSTVQKCSLPACTWGTNKSKTKKMN